MVPPVLLLQLDDGLASLPDDGAGCVAGDQHLQEVLAFLCKGEEEEEEEEEEEGSSDEEQIPEAWCGGEEGEYFLKVLIPSYAAGSIIGKGGQTIVQLQKETGATIKLSKSKDFYPGRRRTPATVAGWLNTH
ncbi:hypothetical protein CRUP_020953 [Coryphaenoides rupestris]|nr:hypothetical protein CRUP_020953 [Coryphaenoides rupestris]